MSNVFAIRFGGVGSWWLWIVDRGRDDGGRSWGRDYKSHPRVSFTEFFPNRKAAEDLILKLQPVNPGIAFEVVEFLEQAASP